MERRQFVKAGLVVAAVPAAPNWKLAMNQATSMAADYRRAMEGYAKAGFKYVEPWVSKIDEFAAKDSLPAAKRILSDNGLTTVAACAQGGIVEPEPEQQKFFDQLKHKLDVCAELGIPRLVVHSVAQGKYTPEDYAPAAERFRKAAEMAKEAGIVIALEAIRHSRFMSSLSTSTWIARQANHPNGRLLVDVFHLWGGFSKFEDLEALKEGEPEHVHIDDMPAGIAREALTDRDRVAPGDGVIPLLKIFRTLRQKKYSGSVSIELFNPRFQQGDPYEVASELKKKSEAVLGRV